LPCLYLKSDLPNPVPIYKWASHIWALASAFGLHVGWCAVRQKQSTIPIITTLIDLLMAQLGISGHVPKA
jgi:hypothetical protein